MVGLKFNIMNKHLPELNGRVASFVGLRALSICLVVASHSVILWGCLLSQLLFYKEEIFKTYFTRYVFLPRLSCLGIMALTVYLGNNMIAGILTVPFSITFQSIGIVWCIATFILNKDLLYRLLNQSIVAFVGKVF